MAEDGFQSAIAAITRGELDLAELIAASGDFASNGRPDLGGQLYKVWIAFNPEHPQRYAAHFNCSALLTDDLAGARAELEAAIALKPDFAPALVNLGGVLEKQGDLEGALERWRSVATHPTVISHTAIGYQQAALRQLGRVLSEKGLFAEACAVDIGGRRVLLAVPLTYMNDSGQAVAPLVRRGGEGAGLIVVHDELDLPSGRIKVKDGGGNAGHNGLKSVDSHLHTNEYLRVRVGIGKPPGRQPGADYVLKRPGAAERAVLAAAVDEAADAVEAIVTDGVQAAMSKVNAPG